VCTNESIDFTLSTFLVHRQESPCPESSLPLQR
jgi:hypothetical protein